MNTYIVYYMAYNDNNVRIGEESIVINAKSKNEACKAASLKIEGKHSIQFASLIKGIDNDSIK